MLKAIKALSAPVFIFPLTSGTSSHFSLSLNEHWHSSDPALNCISSLNEQKTITFCYLNTLEQVGDMSDKC